MRTDEQIKKAVQAGQVRVPDAQLEVLLDVRQLLQVVADRLKKPGRPRKKSGPKPAQ